MSTQPVVAIATASVSDSISVTRVVSGFVMVARASALWIGVGRCSRPRRGVGVVAMLDARLDTTRPFESVCDVPPGAGVLRVLVSGMAVGVTIDCCCVVDWVTVTR